MKLPSQPSRSAPAEEAQIIRVLERAVGIEPTTACLEGRRSTTELRPLLESAPIITVPIPWTLRTRGSRQEMSGGQVVSGLDHANRYPRRGTV